MRRVWMSPSPDMRVNAEPAHAKGKLLMDQYVWSTTSVGLAYRRTTAAPFRSVDTIFVGLKLYR